MPKKSTPAGQPIAVNRKAKFDYSLGERFEAGIALEGWEVKALRAGRVDLAGAHVFAQNGEVFLAGVRISPLDSASTHLVPAPERVRKLLLHKREIHKIQGGVELRGNTCVPTRFYWKGGVVKCEIAVATGKKKHDKRAAVREREWNRDKARLNRRFNR